jgi:hypothetical protein
MGMGKFPDLAAVALSDSLLSCSSWRACLVLASAASAVFIRTLYDLEKASRVPDVRGCIEENILYCALLQEKSVILSAGNSRVSPCVNGKHIFASSRCGPKMVISVLKHGFDSLGLMRVVDGVYRVPPQLGLELLL